MKNILILDAETNEPLWNSHEFPCESIAEAKKFMREWLKCEGVDKIYWHDYKFVEGYQHSNGYYYEEEEELK